MTVFKVIKKFVDLKDNLYVYNVGDTYPRKGLSVTDERLKELASNNNKRGEALIIEVFEKEEKEDVVDAKELLEEIETKKKSRKKKK